MKITQIISIALGVTLLLSACGTKEQSNQFYTLKNENGMELTLTNFGARLVKVNIPDKNGVVRDVVLGFDKVEDYYPENNSSDFGASIGRYANRINEGKFTLDGVEYQLPINNFNHSLHGGPTGWQYQPYTMVKATKNSLKFRIISPDGDNNYPGEVTAFVTYTLTEDNKIDIQYEATTTAPTIINMTNHSYFNLTGDPANNTCEDHILYLNSSNFTPMDATCMPTGEIRPVAGSPMDFTKAHKIGDRINETSDEQVFNGNGYDHNWILNNDCDINVLAAELYCESTGINMQVYTNEPGVQFYTGNFLDGTVTGKGGIKYNKRAGVCLETQHFPDSPNHPEWASTVLRPGETYHSHCIYAFSIK